MTTHRCRLCRESAPDPAAICAGCERTYGPRVARLLARAERDPSFAQACLANFPSALRQRFAALLAKRCVQPGADTWLGPGLRATSPRVDPKWRRAAN